MRVLLDTNILMDYLTEREPFYQDARQIVINCKNEQYEGVLAAHSIVDMFYILRKHFTNAERRKLLLALFKIFTIEAVDEEKLRIALKNESFEDFEDCLQVECAKAVSADIIVTRDKEFAAISSVPCVTPSEFCDMFDE